MEDVEEAEEAEEAEEVPLTLQRSRMIVWVARLGDGDGEAEAEGGIWTDKISTILNSNLPYTGLSSNNTYVPYSNELDVSDVFKFVEQSTYGSRTAAVWHSSKVILPMHTL